MTDGRLDGMEVQSAHMGHLGQFGLKVIPQPTDGELIPNGHADHTGLPRQRRDNTFEQHRRPVG